MSTHATARTLETAPKRPSKALERTILALRIIAFLFFIAASLSKLTGAEYNVVVFEKVGFGQWFRYFTGVLELTGAVLLFVPGRAAWGGALLSCIMIGAFFADRFLIGGNGVPAIIAFIVVATVTWFRRSQLPFFSSASGAAG